MLAEVLTGYAVARTEPKRDHPTQRRIRIDIPRALRLVLADRAEPLRVRGSAGGQSWASVPWIGVFDPTATTSAERGTYVVFLLNYRDEVAWLSLVHGARGLLRERGTTEGLAELRRRTASIRARLSDLSDGLDPGPIDLGSDKPLPRSYEVAHALGRRFRLEDLRDAPILEMLHRLLDLHATLRQRVGDAA